MIELSQRERYCIFVVFDQQDWGGNEEVLLTRDDAYEWLHLEEFERTDPRVGRVGGFSSMAAPYELPPAVVDYLLVALPRAGQSRELGRTCASIVRRLRAAAGAKKEPVTP
jgi:hypothetical protein